MIPTASETNTASDREKRSLKSVLQSLEKTSHDTDHVTIDQVLASVEKRGFGPLLIVPALLVGLPTGAIPGVPAIGGLLIIMISVQILLGWRRPWLPEKVLRIDVNAQTIRYGVSKAMPLADQLDRHLHRRFSMIAENSLTRILIALTVIALAVAMIVFGFVPFLPMIFSLPIILFGLGMMVGDGLIFAIAYGIILIALVFLI